MKKIDPPVKTRITIDPDTGARMFNQSWSSELKKKEPIQRKPVSRETFVSDKKAVAKPMVKSKPSVKETTVKTSGERNFSEVVKPKMASSTMKAEIKTSALPTKKVTPALTKKEIVTMKVEKDNEDLKKNYPGMSLEDARAKRYKQMVKSGEKRAKENRKFYSVGTGDGSEKQKSSSACQSGCR